MKTHYDVGIVGGGIIGQSIAYELAKEGVAVLLLESNKFGFGATSAAAGMLGANSELENNDAFFQFAKESQQHYKVLADELFDLSQINIQLVNRGMYKLAMTDQEAGLLKNTVANYKTLEWHPREEVLRQEPSISPYIKGALFIPEDGHVSPTHVCAALSKSASLLGATILEHSPVHSIKKTNKNEFIVSTNQSDFTCKQVVIANGTWSGYFFKQLGLEKEIIPVKGECLSVKSSNLRLEKTVFYDHCYIVPKGDGRFVVGATMVENDWSTDPTVGGIQKLIEKIEPIMPEITHAKLLETWAGLRPKSVDGKPYIGCHPDDENLYFATGHYRNGILLAPKTGMMIKDFVLRRQQTEDYVNAFAINRKHMQTMG